MSRVEKFNPLKSSALTKKMDEQKAKDERQESEILELTFDSVKQDAIRFGLATDLLYQMNAGKEASIYLALWKEHPIVLKAYRLYRSSHHVSTKSGFQGVATSKRSHLVLQMVENFAVVEYDLLMNCFRAGMHVPTPIGRVGNYLTMRFLGDKMQPAPKLKDVALEQPELVFDQILDEYFIMYRDVHYVHGDLSKYNILWWQEQPWIIDVPQAYRVDTHCDMRQAESMLRRDLQNVVSYFESYGIYRDTEHILQEFLDAYVPHNMRNYRESTGGSYDEE
jgi:RIO kinase 1